MLLFSIRNSLVALLKALFTWSRTQLRHLNEHIWTKLGLMPWYASYCVISPFGVKLVLFGFDCSRYTYNHARSRNLTRFMVPDTWPRQSLVRFLLQAWLFPLYLYSWACPMLTVLCHWRTVCKVWLLWVRVIFVIKALGCSYIGPAACLSVWPLPHGTTKVAAPRLRPTQTRTFETGTLCGDWWRAPKTRQNGRKMTSFRGATAKLGACVNNELGGPALHQCR